jgi:hypothetical protein
MARTSVRTFFAMMTVLVVGGATPGPQRATAEELPFKARLAGNAMLTPTGDPCVMQNNATAVGNATHAGRFTWSTEERVNFCTVPGGIEVSGSFTLTGANGDSLEGRFAAIGQFDETGTLVIAGSYEITGGTGRFIGATGSGNTDVVALFTPGLPFTAALSGTLNY